VWLHALLASLERAGVDAPAWEILVVDDASTDDTTARLAVDFPQVRVLRADSRQGPAAARNRGAAAARGAWLVFLDADGEVADTWAHAVCEAQEDDTLLLGNVVDFDSGRVQSVPRRATFIGKSLPAAPHRANTGPSCNLALPRHCFEALGGFDEELPYYFEDSDLCIRAQRAGYAFKFLEKAIFRHHGTEKKQGEAIYLQECHSTYAMLKFYEDNPALRLAFTLANACWMVLRLASWMARGHVNDGCRLYRGWREAYRRFGQRKRSTCSR
jgi:GT2 family glycosyltransferase